MWTAIALENAPAIEVALRRTEKEIAALRDAIKRADQDDLMARFREARAWWDGVPPGTQNGEQGSDEESGLGETEPSVEEN
jgi:hypothetical protein